MGLYIVSFIVGGILFVGGYTYFINFDPDEEHISWRLEAIPYILFLILGKNQKIFRVFVCFWGILLIIYGGSGLLKTLF